MSQMSFFDLSRRYLDLDKKNDPLVTLAHVVPWEIFWPRLEAALLAQGHRTSAVDRKNAAGRKPWDVVLIFKALKALVVQALYNLSDEQAEYQFRDRLSFMRFLGIGLENAVPDATTLWLYREALSKAGAVEALFAMFDGYLRAHGYQAMGGQIVDASIVPAPNSTMIAMKTPPSAVGRRHQNGKQSRPRSGKKTPMRVARAKMKIGMQNLVYNMTRFGHLEQIQATAS